MANPSAQDAARRLIILSGLVAYANAQPPSEVWSKLYPTWSKEEQERFFEEFKKIPQGIAKFFREVGVWDYLSPKEDIFLHSYPQDLDDHDRNNFSWRSESAFALMWALGLSPEFPEFDAQQDHSLLKTVNENAHRLITDARLHSPEELEKMRSLAQSWHWRSRTRELIEQGRTFPIIPKAPQFKTFDDVVRFSAKTLAKEGVLKRTINEDYPAKDKAYRDLTREEWSEVRSITMERHFALNWVCGYAPENRWDDTPIDT